MGTVFCELGGSEIDSDFLVGEGKVRIRDGGTDALAGFGDGFIGHTDDVEGGQTLSGVTFYFNDTAVIAIGDSGIYFCDHRESVAKLLLRIQIKMLNFVNFTIAISIRVKIT